VVKGDRPARLETWVAECIDPAGQEWRITSSLSQPAGEGPWPHALTGQPYTSVGGEVSFVIAEGNQPFLPGDNFIFTTTGITALSEPVIIYDGAIREDPVAIMSAMPRIGNTPLIVVFDGRASFDPSGGDLAFLWEFGDGGVGDDAPLTLHEFAEPGAYQVRLRVTNPSSGRFGESIKTVVAREAGARRGDWNDSLSLDLLDYGQLAHCIDASGPQSEPGDPRCIEVFDFDDDFDVDLDDARRFFIRYAEE